MKIEWAKYLREMDEVNSWIMDEKYLNSWKSFLKKEEKKIASKKGLVLLGGNMTIQNQHMILEYVLINKQEEPIKDIEVGVTLSIKGKQYFSGRLKTAKDCYDDLEVNSARLDIIDFGNDRFDNQKLSPKDYELKIHYCKGIEYIDGEENESETS